MADPTNEPTPMPRAGLIPDPNASPTAQILGTSARRIPARDEVDPKWRPFFDQLIQRRDSLIDSHTDLSAKTVEIAPDALQREAAEIGTEEFQRDQLLGVRTLEQETLEEIDAALSRIASGSYGICEATGKPIPEERLAAIPWARFTREAEQEMEARGKTTRAGIGPRGNMRERGTAPPGPWRDHEGST